MKIQGQPSYKALQIYRWLHRGVSSFEEMTDLSKIVRQFLTKIITYLLQGLKISLFQIMIIP